MNMKRKTTKLFDKAIASRALADAFVKLDPRLEVKNPVMFVVFLGAILTSIVVIGELLAGKFVGFNIQIMIWLWLTVLFANFAEAVAEGRGKAQADSLRKMRTKTMARRLVDDREEKVTAAELKIDDMVICEAGDIIPGDGEVIEGIASVDESAITGESAPVIRESGGDRSAVTSGTRVLSDKIIIRITSEAGNTFLDRMIAMVEGARRRKTPNEIALSILLIALTAIFIIVVISLLPFDIYSEKAAGMLAPSALTLPILVSLLVCLAPTTIGGLLSAIGISGMDRMIQRNVLAVSGRAVEAAGDIDVLLLDKTGTITLGNRMATEFIPAASVNVERLADAAQLASLADETPEGRSIVVLAKERFGLRGRDIKELQARFVPFSAQTQMSGVDIPAVDGRPARSIRKGSLESIRKYLAESGATDQASSMDMNVALMIGTDIAMAGGTPLLVVENLELLGIIQLKDVVKGGIKERFEQLRAMGIRTVMITGDNPFTAASIAAEAGVDDFIAQATPETKLQCIREEQAQGRLVAMIGDGTNDAPALAQADVGVAMNSGTQAAREAGNMVDLDSNPTKLIEIVEIGKQLLMTRGALTTFSIANDVAKYFAILPALFSTLYAVAGGVGPLAALNIMKLTSPQSAILSAVIFNALIIIALVPLALRGIKYRPLGANAILIRNLMIYGVGGFIVPFIGIKLIDILIVALKLV
ncbi:MAG: potassium-transporting ATPase subunit KdpB [Candidatus Marinimicrobia bacterium]|nr:potassium-transporting ATPase subunit KdpB [Candidatus Neomarinimicrobiota bacterium]